MNPRKPRCCEICNKTFKRHENLVLHQNKAKSCEPATKLFKCQYCNEGYRSINGLKYHVEKCVKNINDSDSVDDVDDDVNDINIVESNKYLIKQLAKKDAIIEKLKDEKMEKMENDMKKLENENTLLKTLVNNNKINATITGNEINVDNSVNNTLNNNNNTINNTIYLTSKHIKEKYTNGPTLEAMPTYDVIMDTNINGSLYVTKLKQYNENDLLYNKKIAFVETLLSITNNGRMIKYVSDILVTFYKKDDPALQALWSTDTSRFTFMIRCVVDDSKECAWLIDKLGEKIKNKMIKPLLKYIEELITLYQKRIDPVAECNKHLKCLKLLKMIKSDGMVDNILKKITPQFSFNGIKV